MACIALPCQDYGPFVKPTKLAWKTSNILGGYGSVWIRVRKRLDLDTVFHRIDYETGFSPNIRPVLENRIQIQNHIKNVLIELVFFYLLTKGLINNNISKCIIDFYQHAYHNVLCSFLIWTQLFFSI